MAVHPPALSVFSADGFALPIVPASVSQIELPLLSGPQSLRGPWAAYLLKDAAILELIGAPMLWLARVAVAHNRPDAPGITRSSLVSYFPSCQPQIAVLRLLLRPHIPSAVVAVKLLHVAPWASSVVQVSASAYALAMQNQIQAPRIWVVCPFRADLASLVVDVEGVRVIVLASHLSRLVAAGHVRAWRRNTLCLGRAATYDHINHACHLVSHEAILERRLSATEANIENAGIEYGTSRPRLNFGAVVGGVLPLRMATVVNGSSSTWSHWRLVMEKQLMSGNPVGGTTIVVRSAIEVPTSTVDVPLESRHRDPDVDMIGPAHHLYTHFERKFHVNDVYSALILPLLLIDKLTLAIVV